MNKKVLVAMSGGVDSSVAAFILKNQGYDCVGATMKLFSADNGDNTENNNSNINDAEKICEMLGIPFYVFDFSKQFKNCVIDSFVNAYEKGLTPNPCIECNKFLKFGFLFDKAKELGCDYVATGHYAVIEKQENPDNAINTTDNTDCNNICYLLKKAKDITKDQSYFLYSLTEEQLEHTLFPLGGYTKDEIRKIAEENGFVNANRRDSQDVCFIPDGKYAEFIKMHTGKNYPEGDFIDINGNILGRHKGIINYTIGQRKGLGIALNEPMYVKEVNPDENTVMLARDDELFSDELYADNIRLANKELFFESKKNDDSNDFCAKICCKAKIRYRHTESDATVYVKDDIMKVVFDKPQRAVTKGQAVVLYKDDYVVGGGTII